MSNEIADPSEALSVTEQPYISPRIVHELRLETRAGSPLGIDPLIDPLSLGVPER